MSRIVLLVVLGLVSVGCCPMKKPDTASQLTVEDALQQIGRGLAKMQTEARQGQGRTFGYFGHDIVVNLKVDATTTNTKALVVSGEAGSGALLPGGATAGVKFEKKDGFESIVAQGNSITIRFLNPMFAPKDTAMFAATTQPSAFQGLFRETEYAPLIVQPAIQGGDGVSPRQ